MSKPLNTLAVVSQSGQSLNFYDAHTGQKTGQLKDLTAEPHELAYDDRTNLLYITHAYRHGWYPAHGDPGKEISVLDCATRKIVDMIDVSPYGGPHGMIVDKPRNILYVSVEYGFEHGGGVLGIDMETRKVVKAIPSGWRSHWFTMTPDGKKAYTSNKEAGFISVLDLEKGEMVGKIDCPGGNEQPGVSNDGKFVFFPTPTVGVGMRSPGGDFHIKVIDTATDEVVKTIPLEGPGSAVHVDSKDRLLVGQYRFDPATANDKMPKSLPGRLTVFDGDFKELGEFESGLAPLTVYASPDGSMASTANIFQGTVTVVDLEKMASVRTLDVDVELGDKQPHGGAHGMALIP